MKVLAVRDVFVDTRPQISFEDMLWVLIEMKLALRDHVRLSSRPRILLTVGTPEKEIPVPTSSASLLPGLNSNPRLQTLCIWYRSAEETEIVNTRRQAMNPRSLNHGRSTCVPWKEETTTGEDPFIRRRRFLYSFPEETKFRTRGARQPPKSRAFGQPQNHLRKEKGEERKR